MNNNLEDRTLMQIGAGIRQRTLQLAWIRIAGQYGLAALSVLVVSFVSIQLHLRASSTNFSILYLSVVLCCAVIAHPGVTLFCGLFSFICYDFFLVPPVFNLTVETPSQLLDPLAFLCVALVTCVLAGRSRQRAMQTLVYREADQLRSTLLNLVSHNLRTPLATIKTALTTLLTLESLSPEGAQLLRDADQECDRLNRLIGNVLRLSRLEAHALRLNKQWNAPDEVISTSLQRWPLALAAGTLSAKIPDSLPLIEFDFDLIEAVLINLIDNAFTHGDPPVQVEVRAQGNEVRFCVIDHGPGLPLHAHTKLFTHYSSTSTNGIGLGLVLCKALIELHGGRIWAEPGQSQFCFTLPMNRDCDAPADR